MKFMSKNSPDFQMFSYMAAEQVCDPHGRRKFNVLSISALIRDEQN
jgi:hypothetical protein